MGIESPVHLLFLAAVALIVLGPKRLPALAKALGQGIREFRESLTRGRPPGSSGGASAGPRARPGGAGRPDGGPCCVGGGRGARAGRFARPAGDVDRERSHRAE